MTHLDGNVLAGPLAEVFGFDATEALARCSGCGSVAALAAAMVWADDAGYVVRCGTCDDVLATIVVAPDRVWLSMRGITALEIVR
jgi:uncharacterized Zn finger protein